MSRATELRVQLWYAAPATEKTARWTTAAIRRATGDRDLLCLPTANGRLAVFRP